MSVMRDEIMAMFGYTSEWLDWGIIDERYLRKQYDEFQQSEDKNPEHYRHRAFVDFLDRSTEISDDMVHKVFCLRDNGPDETDLSSQRVLLLLWSNVLSDEQLEHLSTTHPIVLGPRFRKEYLRSTLHRAIMRTGVSANFSSIQESSDAAVHQYALWHPEELERHHVEWLAEYGGDKKIRNQAAQLLRSRRFRGPLGHKNRVTGELPAGQVRTPAEVSQACNLFKRNRDDARRWYEERTGRQWPSDATHYEHPRALAEGGDPLFVQPGFGGSAAPHMVPGQTASPISSGGASVAADLPELTGETIMFDWLVNEMARISTRKFHVVDGALSHEQRELVEKSELAVPPSYRQFVIQFGNAKLYRQRNVHLVQVFAIPADAETEDGETLLHFGRTDMALAYFKESLLVPGAESPVFEWRHEQGLQQTTNGFEEWLKAKCEATRKLFKKKQWAAIEKGPPPFMQQEQAIVEARRRFCWRVVGVADNGDLRFEIYNGSDIVLPFLSIGLRGRNGKVNGGVWLPVSSVRSGQTRVIEKDCYKDLLSPDEVDVFEQPDPEPEDRDRYWEFRALV